jgi:hypothetical protein
MLEPSKTYRLVWRNPDTGVDDPVIGTAEYIPVTALASTFTLGEGRLEPYYDGEPELHWDRQMNIGDVSGVKPYHHFAVVTESGEIVDVADCIRILIPNTSETSA